MLGYKMGSPAIFSLVLLHACGPPGLLDEGELRAYVLNPSNGLTISRSQENVQVRVSYHPTGLLLASDLGSADLVEQQKLYEGYHYFLISLSKEGKELLYNEQGDFSNRLRTLAFNMSKYLNLTTSQADTIPVADYTFPRTFGMSGATQLLVVFDRSKTKEKDWVQLNMNEFGFGIGNQRFRFRVKDLENAPGLKIDYIQNRN
ncbi:MAG: hypothetical protein MJA30_09195 [Cytophagales bacterium]|nr:hypothetical protein [Cytophagales bacterium]